MDHGDFLVMDGSARVCGSGCVWPVLCVSGCRCMCDCLVVGIGVVCGRMGARVCVGVDGASFL